MRLWPAVKEWIESALAGIGALAPDRGPAREIRIGMTDACGPLSPGTIIYNAEQVAAEAPYWRRAGEYAALTFWDFSARNEAPLRARGVRNWVHCPLGWASAMERSLAGTSEPCDVLFYGAMNERRHKILDAVEREGLRVSCLSDCYDRPLDEAIRRSKIVLNLHYYPNAVHEILRTGYLFANRKCVVSEPSVPEPCIDRIAAAAWTCPAHEIPAACRFLASAAGEPARLAQGEAGYASIRVRAPDFASHIRSAIDQTLRLESEGA